MFALVASKSWRKILNLRPLDSAYVIAGAITIIVEVKSVLDSILVTIRVLVDFGWLAAARQKHALLRQKKTGYDFVIHFFKLGNKIAEKLLG